jgi:hypothetical protein
LIAGRQNDAASMTSTISAHIYRVRPRKDHRGFDLISDALPFGRLWYTQVSHAIGYAEFYSRSHDAVIRVYAGNIIEIDCPSFPVPVPVLSAANVDGLYHLSVLRDSLILILRVRQKSVVGHEYARPHTGASITD